MRTVTVKMSNSAFGMLRWQTSVVIACFVLAASSSEPFYVRTCIYRWI